MRSERNDTAGADRRAAKRKQAQQQRAPAGDKLLQQRVPQPSGQSRTSEGASTGKSAKSTAGGAAGQLTAKD
ncbi:hypothetical protein J7E62_05640 [Variovorax paradoxus]|nr:hypothetical protein [Variovorax paradoxus]